MKWDAILKFPFYRIFVSFAVGTIAYFIFRTHESVQSIFKCFNEKDLLSFWYLCVPLFWIVGEVFCMLGEMMINPFFDYHPFHEEEPISNRDTKDAKVEKIYPCSDQYIYFRYFDRDSALEFSEVHFVLSRMFAGLMVIGMSLIFPLLPFVLAIIISFVKCLHSRLSWDFCKCLFILLFSVIAILITTVCVLMAISSLRNECYDRFGSVLVLVIFSAIASIYYRSHANKMIYFSKNKPTGGV